MPEGTEVLVFGGTGFIGSHVVRLLLDRGHSVRIVTRQAGRTCEPRVTYVRADLGNPAALEAAFDGISAAVNLATGGGERWSDFERDVIEGTHQLAKFASKHRVHRFIFVSSIAALYLGRKQTLTESTWADEKFQRRSLYSRSKILTESLLNKMHAEEGLPVVILRPGVVVGPGGPLTHGGLGYWPSDISCIGWGRGENPLPFVLVQDVAEALVSAIKTANIDGSTFNLVGDVRLSAAEFLRILAFRSHRNFEFFPQSRLKLQLIDVLKWAAKIAARKNDNPFPSYRDLKSRSLESALDCSAAKQILGWRPVQDREKFLHEAIDANLQPIAPSDLRLSPRK